MKRLCVKNFLVGLEVAHCAVGRRVALMQQSSAVMKELSGIHIVREACFRQQRPSLPSLPTSRQESSR